MLRRLGGERLSVLDEVLRGHARHRWWRRAGVAALLLAVFAALWLDIPRAGGPSGAVTGYVRPCSGIGVPVDSSTGARLFSAAALVEALPGQQRQDTAADGTFWVALPKVVASRERVSQNQAFELEDLAPGRYVILAQYTGINMSTFVDVSVAAGQVVTVELPDLCK
jgi:hypothetical protein